MPKELSLIPLLFQLVQKLRLFFFLHSKWYISDTICKNLASILHFRQIFQILADQTFLVDSNVSRKILAGQDHSCTVLGRILQNNVPKLKKFLVEKVCNVRKPSERLFSFSNHIFMIKMNAKL